MKIQEDMSFVETSFVDRGLMRVIPYSIHFDRYFKEEEKAGNRGYSEEEWNTHCEEVRKRISEESHKLMEYLKILENYEAQNIQAVIQYDQAEITERVEAEAERICKEHIGKYITYGTTTGKLEKRNGEYLFKRKYAKRYAYRLRPIDICSMVM